MELLDLPESKINQIVDFINEQEKQMSQIEEKLAKETGSMSLTEEALGALSEEKRMSILSYRNNLISIGQGVIAFVSNILQKLKIFSKKLATALISFTKRLLNILTKYLGMFKIDSISIEFSATPKVTVTLKP